VTRHGEQKGAKKRYTRAKRGRCSHHPLIAFIDDAKLVSNMWLRSGHSSSSNNFLAFLEETLSKFKNKTVSLIRLDSGFFQFNILDYLEQKETGQSALDQIQLNPDSALEIYCI
jgi:hypothetical protein